MVGNLLGSQSDAPPLLAMLAPEGFILLLATLHDVLHNSLHVILHVACPLWSFT